jgi:hypothetical protein
MQKRRARPITVIKQGQYLPLGPTSTENVMTDKLPDGVHRLSEESAEILKRIAARPLPNWKKRES